MHASQEDKCRLRIPTWLRLLRTLSEPRRAWRTRSARKTLLRFLALATLETCPQNLTSRLPKGRGTSTERGEEGNRSDVPRRRAGQVSHQSYGCVTRLRKSRNGSSHSGTRFNARSFDLTRVTSAGSVSTPASESFTHKNAFFCVGCDTSTLLIVL